jgi:aminocarboxymuconate-semialdehyde decarboxylase
MKIIDMHTHIFPKGLLDDAKKDGRFGVKLIDEGGKRQIVFRNGVSHPYDPVFFDMDARKAEMDRQKIDVQGISVGPHMFYYDYPADTAAAVARLCNDEIHQICQADAERFFPVGTLPLQDAAESVRELRRIHGDYGFRVIQIGTEINGEQIASDRLIPFYREAEKLGVSLIVHPFLYGEYKFLGEYYLMNYIGNTVSTTIAAAYLIFSGMLERFPGLQIALCHAGGYLPYQIGRFDHGWEERPESRLHIQEPPSSYFRKNFWFDTILHDPSRTKSLIEMVGVEKVMLGSDYPYDMADHDPYRTAVSLGLSETDFAAVVCENTRRILL